MREKENRNRNRRRAYLIEAFPSLAEHVNNGVFDECFDFSVGSGWSALIADLTTNLVEAGAEVEWEVAQVKEKFGGLRYYIHGGTAEMNELIRGAEVEASKTCETCGAPGERVSNNYWITTLCDKCRKEREEEEEEEEK